MLCGAVMHAGVIKDYRKLQPPLPLPQRLINLTRSASHVDYMFPEVDAGVAKTVKTELKARMDAQIAANPTEYQPPASVILKTMANTNLKVVLQISFTFNFPGDAGYS